MSAEVSNSAKHTTRNICLAALGVIFIGVSFWWFILRTDDNDTPFVPKKVHESELIKIPVEEREMMGTYVRIQVYAKDEELAMIAIESAFARGQEIADICTDWDPNSELMKLSQGPVNSPIPVSTTLATVLEHAVAMASITEGVFDPTLGPLTKLWRRSEKEKKLPTDEELAAAKELANWNNLKVDLEGLTVTLKKAGMQLDLGGIAKGFAADEMLDELNQSGITVAYVGVAGDVRLGDPPPGKDHWQVGIRSLSRKVQEYVNLRNCAVSTSGDLYRYLEIDGTRYSHIINPRTGLGLTYRAAATVVAPTAIQTDPLATFCCIDPVEALRLFVTPEISCRITILRNGETRSEATQHFPELHNKQLEDSQSRR